MDQWPYVGGLSFPIQRHFVLNPIYDDLDGMLSRTDHKAVFSTMAIFEMAKLSITKYGKIVAIGNVYLKASNMIIARGISNRPGVNIMLRI